MLKYLQLKLEGKSVEDFREFFLSYDNICHAQWSIIRFPKKVQENSILIF